MFLGRMQNILRIIPKITTKRWTVFKLSSSDFCNSLCCIVCLLPGERRDMAGFYMYLESLMGGGSPPPLKKKDLVTITEYK